MADGLAAYTGVRRRFELKGAAAGSPCTTTTRTTRPRWRRRSPPPAAFRHRADGASAARGRLVVVFQPHLYSRTETFADAFGGALGGADLVVVLDVYGAREDPQTGGER